MLAVQAAERVPTGVQPELLDAADTNLLMNQSLLSKSMMYALPVCFEAGDLSGAFDLVGDVRVVDVKDKQG